jgi:site-specific DNA-cytosine methylase
MDIASHWVFNVSQMPKGVPTMTHPKTLTAIDVCAGAGGWAVAARGLPIRIIAAFDLAADCLATYHENHPDVECIQCDVLTHDFSTYRRHVDLVLGGIPCEQISAARRGTPLSDAHRAAFSQLVERCIAIPREIEASWFCFEDVREVQMYLPIMTPGFLLDAALFSPQRRLRFYAGNVPCPQPTSHDTRLFSDCARPGPYRQSLRLAGRTPGRASVYNSTQFYPWMPNEKSPTVINLESRHDNYAAAQTPDGRWRQLEWQELARLQGFPEGYLFIGTPGRTGKQVAQAVQIDTARAILRALCAGLGLPNSGVTP